MSSFFQYLDDLPIAPLALFALAYGVLLVLVLVLFKRQRFYNRCDLCGSSWRVTARGAEYHVCTPPGDQPITLSIRGASDHTGPRP